MLRTYVFLLVALYCSDGVLSKSLITPCKIEDGACIEKSWIAASEQIIQGIPELGIEPADPLFIEKIEGNLSTLKYKYFNTTIVGYKNCRISDVKVSNDFKNYHYELNIPELKLHGMYEMAGRLISMSVEGKGEFFQTTGNYKIIVDAELKVAPGDDGKLHMAIGDFKLKCYPLTAIHFDYRNLFNGDKDLGDAVLKFANESWEEVANLTQDPVFEAIITKLNENANKLLKFVPLEEFIIN
ncbi:protein takeout-like [Bicyclus anynana]|uniref:Protein takeout-like n=1 Tax=Bicyclus anynana TaxID=110368 RepID=A0A6J1N876_BICAN|nr:protein takeout-like [Bicyclus anynana]